MPWREQLRARSLRRRPTRSRPPPPGGRLLFSTGRRLLPHRVREDTGRSRVESPQCGTLESLTALDALERYARLGCDQRRAGRPVLRAQLRAVGAIGDDRSAGWGADAPADVEAAPAAVDARGPAWATTPRRAHRHNTPRNRPAPTLRAAMHPRRFLTCKRSLVRVQCRPPSHYGHRVHIEPPPVDAARYHHGAAGNTCHNSPAWSRRSDGCVRIPAASVMPRPRPCR